MFKVVFLVCCAFAVTSGFNFRYLTIKDIWEDFKVTLNSILFLNPF